MDRRTCLEQLLEAERKCLETVRHDPNERTETALCGIRIGVYRRLLSTRDVVDFRCDADVDEFKSEVDDIVREYATALRRFDGAVVGLTARSCSEALAAE